MEKSLIMNYLILCLKMRLEKTKDLKENVDLMYDWIKDDININYYH